MIDQRLYIDNVLMDVDDDTDVTLDIVSNLFRDITQIECNKSYTIKLPKTIHNLSVFGNSDVLQSNSDSPFQSHTCQYYRNGLHIIQSGSAVLLSVGDEIEICILFGLNAAFEKLKKSEISLRDLDISETIRFDKQNAIATVEDAKQKGIFYASYNPFIAETTNEWNNSEHVQSELLYTEKKLTDGEKYYTGESIGEALTLKPESDAIFASIVVTFTFGMDAYMTGGYGVSGYRNYAVLDSSNKVIELGDIDEKGFAVIAQTNAALLVVNVDKSKSSSLNTLNIREVTNNSATPKKNSIMYANPCVTVNWILDKIRDTTGVSFDFQNDLVDSLVIPLVTRNIASNTMQGVYFKVKAEDTAKKGILNIQSTDIPGATSIKDNKITFNEDVNYTVSVRGKWTWYVDDDSLSRTYNQYDENRELIGRIFVYATNRIYISIIIERGTETVEYKVGGSSDNLEYNEVSYSTNSKYSGYRNIMIAGNGNISFQKGDVVHLEVKGGSPKGLTVTDVEMLAYPSDSTTVPYGVDFPIKVNLPDVKVIDFVRFLETVTATFPKQNDNSETIQFIPFGTVENKDTAIDWSKKIIHRDGYNRSRQIEYSIEDVCQHNWYKWKEDSKTVYNYDADMRVDNETLEYERDVITFPFAATDGNRIPIIKIEESKSDRTSALSKKYSFSECEPRIMTFESSEYASLTFGIKLQKILHDGYTFIREHAARAKVITERIALRDSDIVNFDETRPIYIQQYGSYFAVLEIKTANKEYSEVKLIKL